MAMPPPDTGSLQRISGHAAAWPLLATASARQHEAEARNGHPAGTLMARAGLAVARLALALAPRGRRAVVLCGPGDNGGDGLVAARHLKEAGWDLQVHRIAGSRPPSADTAAALQAANAAGLEPLPCPARLPEADLVIDALLGLGSQRAPEGEVAQAIAAIRASPAPVLAVDLPSGLHPDTGVVLGQQAVVAAATLCALSLRPGCFTHEGRDHAGTVWLADLGHPAASGSAWLGGACQRLARPHASHKGRKRGSAAHARGTTDHDHVAEAALVAGVGPRRPRAGTPQPGRAADGRVPQVGEPHGAGVVATLVREAAGAQRQRAQR
ncbi:MAG: NAD(P)H-hydrate epimerase, partial [Rubrivivax sp.]